MYPHRVKRAKRETEDPGPGLASILEQLDEVGEPTRQEPRAFDPLAYEVEHGYHPEWPAWIPMRECLQRALEYAPTVATMTPEVYASERERIVDVIAFAGSEHLGIDTGKLTKKRQKEKDAAVRVFGEALGFLSTAPGGVKFCGIWLETVGGETDARILMPRELVDDATTTP